MALYKDSSVVTSLQTFRRNLTESRHRGVVLVNCHGQIDFNNTATHENSLEPAVYRCFEIFKFTSSLMIDIPCEYKGHHTERHHQYFTGQKLDSVLGREYDAIFWNLKNGLNPEILGVISGMIKAGGLLFCFFHDRVFLGDGPDDDYLRMCASKRILNACGNRFLLRCAREFTKANLAIELDLKQLQGNSGSTLTDFRAAQDTFIHYEPIDKPGDLSEEQRLALESIKALSDSPQKRVLLMTADRGRGKTFTLGVAAQEISQRQSRNKAALTAPNKNAVRSAMADPESDSKAINFVALDDLLITKPDFDILMVDEAAAIPVSMLEQIVNSYPHCVFSTTIHGYEGCGQGFSIKFKQLLKQRNISFESISLEKAIRWGDNDPLEAAVGNALCLNAEFKRLDSQTHDHSKDVVRQISQDELASDDELLQQIVALLVNAHYQTTPSDVRFIMDHPHVSLFVSEHNRTVTGVLMCTNENLDEQLLKDAEAVPADIVDGRRRLRGFLVPQNLSRFYNNTDTLGLDSLRIVRIAVHPDAQRQGLGSRLIQFCRNYAHQNDFDYLSVAYGFDEGLHCFWRSMGFVSYKLGYQKEKSSGKFSMIATMLLSNEAQLTFSKFEEQFSDHFKFGIDRYYQDVAPADVASILGEIENKNSNKQRRIDYLKLSRFCGNNLTEFDAMPDLFIFARQCEADALMRRIEENEFRIVLMRVIQNRTWKECTQEMHLTGRKEGQTLLRKSIEKLLRFNTELKN